MAGTHSAGKGTEARLEVTAIAEVRTDTREIPPGHMKGIRVRLETTAKHVVKAARALGRSVITTTVDRREVTRQEADPASVVEKDSMAGVVAVVSTAAEEVAAVASTVVAEAIASKS